ncbi:ATP-binding protein [Geotoga petraea]|jgi:ferredoxin|uniref:4Fe-4S dicluster domain-containing protein n=1 Tax=Geotoga petraea TaxID=28234 RepID=A0A4Z0W0W3_9BACT|nr:4Fe-4S dicluster domain-containing protein [Geotoga petraea]TGG88713.1 4Fe-4S dicluster domain-containing protein [Geotoga petraea]
MLREIIEIDEDKCNGCGLCIPNCDEGTLQIIDGKARLINDLFCDGLGACVGHCPEGAMKVVVREAEKYDERKVMENIVKGGPNVIKAHLQHLKDHDQLDLFLQGVEYLKEKGIDNPLKGNKLRIYKEESHCEGCFGNNETTEKNDKEYELKQWPVQMHLINPIVPDFENSDLFLCADCVAFSVKDFHNKFLKDRKLAIACPKLDSNQQMYLDKMIAFLNVSDIKSLTVGIMEVPCCGGLVRLAQKAREASGRNIDINIIKFNTKGRVIEEFKI